MDCIGKVLQVESEARQSGSIGMYSCVRTETPPPYSGFWEAMEDTTYTEAVWNSLVRRLQYLREAHL